MSEQEVKAFFDRLRYAKERQIGGKLGKLMSGEDYEKIIMYFLEGKEKGETAKTLISLKPGEAYRFDKRKTGLPRTLNVLCSKEGELKLIVETKSKLANDKKQEGVKRAGAFKTGKPAWRIDSEAEIEYFNLVAGQQGFENLKEEAELSQHIGSDRIDVLELGVKRDTKRSAYSLKAEEDLLNILERRKKEGKEFSVLQENQMALDILEGLRTLHARGFVHRDIKPANILAYGSEEKGYRLKISDLGAVKREGEVNSRIGSTEKYLPPGHDYGGKVSKAQDMWAMGLVYCCIRYGRLPTLTDRSALKGEVNFEWLGLDEAEENTIKRMIADPLLNGLLKEKADERLTVEQAIILLKQQMGLESKKMADLPPPIPPKVARRGSAEVNDPKIRIEDEALYAVLPARKPVEQVVPVQQGASKKPPVLLPKPKPPKVAFEGVSKGNIEGGLSLSRDSRKVTPEQEGKPKSTEELHQEQELDRLLGSYLKIREQYEKKLKENKLGIFHYKNRKTRNDELDKLCSTFLRLRGDEKQDSKSKAKVAYQALSEVESEIGKEHNIFASYLGKLCQEKKQELKQLFPELREGPSLPKQR